MSDLNFKMVLSADNRSLQAAVKQSDASVKKLDGSLDDAADSARQFSSGTDQATESVDGLGSQSKTSGNQVEALGTKAKTAGDKTTESFDGAGASVSTFGRLLPVAAVAGTAAALISLVNNTADAAREIDNLARLANTSREQLQGYSYATQQVGISAEQLGDISKDVQDKLGDFIATGGGEFADFFESVAPKVELTAQELQKLSGPDVLIAVKDAMDQANISAAEQVFYLEAIGNDASRLAPLLRDGGAAMKAQAAEARALGKVLSDVDAQTLLDAAAANDRLDASFEGMSNRIAVYFAPTITNISNLMADMAASGALSAYLDSIGDKFEGFAADVAAGLDVVSQLVSDALSYWNEEISWTGNLLGDAFSNLPENARAMIQLMTVELASMVDYGSSYGKAFAQSLGVELAALVDKAGIYGQELADSLNPFDGDSFDLGAALAQSNATANDMIDSFYAQAEASADATRQARLASIQGILNERDESVASFESQADSAVTLLDEYRKLREARNQAAAAAGTAANDPVLSGSNVESLSERRERELREAQGYNSLEEQQEAEHQAKLAQIRTQKLTESRELELLKKRGYRSKEEAEEAAHQQALADIEAKIRSERLSQTADFFGNIASIAAAEQGKQSAVFKAAAIAQTTIKTYEGATSAYASLAPIPIVGPALGIAAAAAAVSAGLANVRAIASQDVSGIAHGGLTNVPNESTYLLQKGERVLSPNQNRDFTNFIASNGGQSGGRGTIVNIHNYGSEEATATTRTEGDIEVIDVIIGKAVDAAQKAVAADIYQGGGPVSKAGEARYSWTRGAA